MIDVFFDNENINQSPYSVTELGHESSAEREMNMYELARSRGSVIVSAERGMKRIEVRGYIHGSSVGNLEENIDNLFAILNRKGKNLDVDYAGGTRRYRNTYAESTRITKRYPSMAEWGAVFVVPSGVGQTTAQTEGTQENITDAEYIGTVNISGTASPRPSVSIVFDSNSGGDSIDFLLNGNKLTVDVDSAFSASDEVILDFASQKATLNGTEVEYQGVFPEWFIGSNEYTITINGTSRQYDISITYYPTYL